MRYGTKRSLYFPPLFKRLYSRSYYSSSSPLSEHENSRRKKNMWSWIKRNWNGSIWNQE